MSRLMGEDELIALLKCLADRSRLRIVRALATEDLYVELLAERLALASRPEPRPGVPHTSEFHVATYLSPDVHKTSTRR